MDLIAQTLADGLVLGGIDALAAVGFSLIFGVLHVINLSHGVLVLLGAYLALIFSEALHIDPLLCIPAVMAVLFCIGYVYQRFLIQHAVDRASVNSMLLTFGVALMLQNVMIWLFSPDMKNITPSYAFNSFKIGPVNFDAVRVSALIASLVLLSLLAAFLRYSPMGRVIRATAQQTMAARLCGVNVRHVYALTFAVSAAFAGAAGIVIGIILPFSPNDEGTWTLNAFVVVVLGGVGSPAGALIGGLLLGLVSTLTAQYIGPAFPNVTMFLLLVLLLLVRPHGLLGNAFARLAMRQNPTLIAAVVVAGRRAAGRRPPVPAAVLRARRPADALFRRPRPRLGDPRRLRGLCELRPFGLHRHRRLRGRPGREPVSPACRRPCCCRSASSPAALCCADPVGGDRLSDPAAARHLLRHRHAGRQPCRRRGHQQHRLLPGRDGPQLPADRAGQRGSGRSSSTSCSSPARS